MKRVVLVLVVGLMVTCLGHPVFAANNLTNALNDVYAPAITGSPPNEALALPTTVALNSDPVVDNAVNNGSTDLVPLGATVGILHYVGTPPAPEVAAVYIGDAVTNNNTANWTKTPEVVRVTCEIGGIADTFNVPATT